MRKQDKVRNQQLFGIFLGLATLTFAIYALAAYDAKNSSYKSNIESPTFFTFDK